jgi:anti-sigma factor ChrR (cupin superfamily)
MPPSDVRGLCGLALLWCALKYSPAIANETLVSMGEWISAREVEAADNLRKHHPTSTYQPLLADAYLYSPEHWQAIGRQLEPFDLRGRSDEAQTWIRGVAAMLVEPA